MNLTRALALLSLCLLWQNGGPARGEDYGTPGQETHRMAGIGVRVGGDVPGSDRIHEHLIIREVVDGSPAQKEGLKVGDEILAIDDTKLAGRSLSETVYSRLRGPLDSMCTVTIRRPGEAKTFVVPFVRKVIPEAPKTAPRA